MLFSICSHVRFQIQLDVVTWDQVSPTSCDLKSQMYLKLQMILPKEGFFYITITDSYSRPKAYHYTNGQGY